MKAAEQILNILVLSIKLRYFQDWVSKGHLLAWNINDLSN